MESDLNVELIDMVGKAVANTIIHAGQTIAYFDVATIYKGSYFVRVSSQDYETSTKVIIE